MASRTNRSQRGYSDADKAAALAALAANGGNVARTARQLDIPRKTLAGWPEEHPAGPELATSSPPKKGRPATPPPAPEAIAAAAGSLSDQFRSFVGRVLGLTTDDDIRAATLAQRFTAAGIAVDKAQLLEGKATTIAGQAEELTDEQRAQRIAELLDRARERAARPTAPPITG